MAVHNLPGVKGKDYYFVRYGDRIYVVYTVTLEGGKTLEMSWRVDPDQYKAFGIKPGQIRTISGGVFRNLNHMGSAGELERGKHPFQQYLDRLRKRYGPVSWLEDKQFMSVWLEGWVERWSGEMIADKLRRTHWYKSRTDRQVEWELKLSPAQKRAEMKGWIAQVQDTLRGLYGPDFDLKELGFDAKRIKNIAERIASGKWGSPDEGYQTWLSTATRQAEKTQGSSAWIDLQQELESNLEFLNRPEEMLGVLRDDAFRWLGPDGVPTDEVLMKWAENLVGQVKTQAEWEQFLKNRAGKLYPFLGENEPWQDFADPYKAMAERLWGQPLGWEDPALQHLGVTDDRGQPTGAPMSFHEWEVFLRSDDRFYTSDVGYEEGFGLADYLNNIFLGVE